MTDPPSRSGARSEAAELQRRYRFRIVLFLVAAAVVLAFLAAALWTAGAIRSVDAVESKRDLWQRPAEVLEAMELREGAVVVDLGSGVGYFAMKLSERVGRRGRVLAVDVRRFPLLFLQVRALVRGRHNLGVVHGEPDDPHLPGGGIDAVLVANTYHELTHPEPVLGRLFEGLRPGGRLVVVDPGPEDRPAEAHEGGAHHHETPAAAEDRLRRAGFEIVSRQDRFIEAAGQERWWLIVARKPSAGPGDAAVVGPSRSTG